MIMDDTNLTGTAELSSSVNNLEPGQKFNYHGGQEISHTVLLFIMLTFDPN